MTHEEKDALVVRLRERIAELADLLVDSEVKIKKQSERIAELELRLRYCREARDLPIAAMEKRIAELEAQVASTYNEGCDDGHVNRFTEGYNEKEQELT